MNEQDYVVRYCELPDNIHGSLRFDAEGRGNIYLNINDPEEIQKKTLMHEIEHLRRGDLYNDLPISEIESAI